MRVLNLIGKGGFGTVEHVVDDNGQDYARKVFSVNQGGNFTPEMIDNVKRRFIREAQIQSDLKHNNIVPVLVNGTTSEPPYYLMPIASSSLDKDIRNDRTLNGCFLEAIMDILAGLEEIHYLDIYHRDLKPQNVLRFDDQNGQRYAISDFGLMSINDTQLSVITHTGMRMGSDYYTAPEIVADLRKASARSDIYSVGCILHDFVGTSERIPCNEINDDNSLYSDVISICTRRDPERRFRSVSDLREALLSVDYNVEQTTATQQGADFIDLISSSEEMSLVDWERVINFIENANGRTESSDINAILMQVSIFRINELRSLDCYLFIRLGMKYSGWARSESFSFSSCDGIANRLVEFFEVEDLFLQVEVLFALLFMGTSHNRWYVERAFYNRVGSSMSERLARRFVMEMRVEGDKVCRAISHLEHSISVSSRDFHPIVSDGVNQICRL